MLAYLHRKKKKCYIGHAFSLSMPMKTLSSSIHYFSCGYDNIGQTLHLILGSDFHIIIFDRHTNLDVQEEYILSTLFILCLRVGTINITRES